MTHNKRSILVSVSMLVLVAASLAACSSPESTPSPSNANIANTNTAKPAPEKPVDPEVQKIAQGKKTFETTCATCHLEAGTGSPDLKKQGIPDFTDAAWQARHTEEQLRETVMNGEGKIMPPFKEVLSEEEIAQVVAYVRTFAKSGASTGDGATEKKEAAPATSNSNATK